MCALSIYTYVGTYIHTMMLDILDTYYIVGGFWVTLHINCLSSVIPVMIWKINIHGSKSCIFHLPTLLMAYLYARAPCTGGHVEHKKSHSIKHLVIVVSVIFEDVKPQLDQKNGEIERRN